MQCRLRQRLAADNPQGDQGPARDHVDWAGLPVNLDMAFSRKQRDKVYVQHLMRKRRAQLSHWWQDGAQPCACETAAEEGHRYPQATEAMPGL